MLQQLRFTGISVDIQELSILMYVTGNIGLDLLPLRQVLTKTCLS